MKKTVKFGLAAFAIAASASVFAQNADVEIENENEYEAIGWTPVAFGLASPVQLPWGCHKWDVFGLDISAIWADNCKMYGLGVSGIAMATRGDTSWVSDAQSQEQDAFWWGESASVFVVRIGPRSDGHALCA